MGQLRLLSLPPETLLDILKRLDYRSIVVCERVCKGLGSLIRASLSLQYQVALTRCVMADGSEMRLSMKQRLQRLLEREAEWRRLTSGASSSFICTTILGLYGGVLHCLPIPSDENRNAIVKRLPSRFRDIEEQQWRIPVQTPGGEEGPVEFMDPSQDLLVLMRKNEEDQHMWHISFLSLLTGEPHPLASEVMPFTPTSVAVDVADVGELETKIQVYHNHVGIIWSKSLHFGLEYRDLLVLDWKAGEIKMVLVGEPVNSFVFVSPHHILLASISDPRNESDDRGVRIYSSLIICDLEDQEKTRYMPKTYSYCAAFELPALHTNSVITRMALYSGHNRAQLPGYEEDAPFHVSPSQLILLKLSIGNWDEVQGDVFELYTLSDSLMAFMESSDRSAVQEPPYFPWLAWGPEHARLDRLQNPGQTDASARLSGVEFALSNGRFFDIARSISDPDRLAIRVRDFYPRRVLKAKALSSGEGDGEHGAVQWEFPGESLIVDGRFEDGMVATRLRYASAELRMPDDLAGVTSDTHPELFVGDDSIVVSGFGIRFPFFIRMHGLCSRSDVHIVQHLSGELSGCVIAYLYTF